MDYFVIDSTEDGVAIEKVERDELLRRLKEDWYENRAFATDMPKESDPAYWTGGTVVLIKGTVITPKAIEVVTDWEIE